MIQDGQKQKQVRTRLPKEPPDTYLPIYTYRTATLAGKQAVQHRGPVTCFISYFLFSFLLFAFSHFHIHL